MTETLYEQYELERDIAHYKAFDVFGENGRYILEMLIDKITAHEPIELPIFQMGLREYEKLPFGAWVQGRSEVAPVIKKILSSLKKQKDEVTRRMMTAQALVKKDIEAGRYNRFSYNSLWYALEYDHALPEIQKVIDRYEWLLRLSQGTVTAEKLELEDIKKIPIPKLFNGKVDSRSGGKEFYTCPLHQEKSPSFCWYREQNSWYCFGGCAKGGDVIDLYMAMHGETFKEAIESLKKFV